MNRETQRLVMVGCCMLGVLNCIGNGLVSTKTDDREIEGRG